MENMESNTPPQTQPIPPDQTPSSASKLLNYILTQYSTRPPGSVNESLTIAQLRGEFQKVCDTVEEEQYKYPSYLTPFKWYFVSIYFIGLMVSGIFTPLGMMIIALLGVLIYWVIYDIQFNFIDRILPGTSTLNLFSMINCTDLEHTATEKTLLFVGHINDMRKDSGVLYHLTAKIMHFAVYFFALVVFVGYIVGLFTNNYIVLPAVSIASTVVLFFVMTLYFTGKKNRVSGLATAVCLTQLAQQVKESSVSLLDSTNVGFLVTTNYNERHSGIRAFIRAHSKDERLKPEKTLVVCLDELDDSETLTCYKREGFIKYSTNLYNLIKDAAESEGISIGNVANYIHQPFSFAEEFGWKYQGVVPITAKCRSVKRKAREAKEKEAKDDVGVICIHDDQIKCINDTTKLLWRLARVIDNSAEGSKIPVKTIPLPKPSIEQPTNFVGDSPIVL
ncbi:hypothetical protein EIN_411020 [Entamoeba invadens IP1]|uniref:Uncharacterized protein n=1 Tax=Entamoeba invadens IP1 TaxID=370355 RepID=A0A0A1U702_ENTIV|nr:hypothetical protein EIN_411020 [Entamoeba invadens IP1]ELP87749.1 hypothetical protein EIN_411020 [Entamoeba invadens IP1]|eukprot:XP_004254520.1 hypothetical protein EIN_411020 [Entamoeba invadens IP1]